MFKTLCITSILFVLAVTANAQTQPVACSGTGGGYASWCVGGSLRKIIATSPYRVDFVSPSTVKVCKTTIYNCTTTGVIQRYDSATNRVLYDQYEIRNYFSSFDVGKPFWIFAWNYGEDFGDADQPIFSGTLGGTGAIVDLAVPPRPITSAVDGPVDGSWITVYNVTFDWYSGINATRNSPSWPARYDVLLKHWAWNETEDMATWQTIASNIPCSTSQSDGYCTLNYYGLESGNYRWTVIRKLDVTASTNLQVGPTGPIVFENPATNSPSFTVGFDGRPPGCCR